MKITTKQLKKMIQEEINKTLSEQEEDLHQEYARLSNLFVDNKEAMSREDLRRLGELIIQLDGGGPEPAPEEPMYSPGSPAPEEPLGDPSKMPPPMSEKKKRNY